MSDTSLFNYTGSEQTFVVPAGVTYIDVDVRGAQGGYRHNSAAGRGARVTGRLAVTPGQVLRLWVGRMGQTTGTRPAGGWPDGGAGGSVGPDGSITGCGGGGSSSILPEDDSDAPYVVAGGGGGEAGNASYTRSGGSGGDVGTDGQLRNGPTEPTKDDGGRGGGSTGSNGGAAGGGNATAGASTPGPFFWTSSPLTGGKGSDGVSGISYEEIHGGGGGGGGWGAGGGGGPTAGGGGGGSGLGTSGLTSVDYTTGYEAGDGQILLTYNSAPTAPGAFTSPTAGEEVDTTDTVAVSAATDAEGDTLTYEWDLSLNNGGSYTNRRARQSGTSWTFDYSALAATTTAKWRVRAWDGTVWGPYRYSSLFTIYHNAAPTAPTPTAPASGSVENRLATIRLAATFNDPDAGDSASKSNWRYRLVGAPSWTTVTQNSGQRYYDLPASTLAAGDYEWQARYYDSRGAVSPYSASAFFTAETPPPGPTITSPTSGANVEQDSLVAWSAAEQDAFQVRRVADDAGAPDTATVYYDSGTVESSTARDHPLEFETNDRPEHVQVRTRVAGLWSPWSSVAVQVSYTPPAAAQLATAPVDTGGWGWTDSIAVDITTPAPVGDEPTVVELRLWRRVGDSGDGIRIAVGLPPGEPYLDGAVANAVPYAYLVESIASNGTSSRSDWSLSVTTFDLRSFDPAVFG